MKKLAVFALLLLFTFNFANVVQAEPNIPKPAGDIYVQDFAGVLNDQEKAELIELGKRLDDASKAQVGVLTVDSLEGSGGIEELSVAAFRAFKLGDAKLKNGVLLVLAVKEKKIRIEVGYGLEGAITDIKSGQILDNVAIPHLKENQYNLALTETYKAIYNEVLEEYGLGEDFYQEYAVQPEENTELSGVQILMIVFVAIIVVFLDAKFFKGFFLQTLLNILLMFISRGGGGGGGRGGGGPRAGGGGSSGGGGASRGW